MGNLLIFLSRILFKVKAISVNIIVRSGYFDFLRDSQNPTQPITFDYWFNQFVLRINSGAYWPVHKTSKVAAAENILVGKGSFPGYMPGCYIQGIGLIIIGEHSIFGPNVGIISANHNVYNHAEHIPMKVEIGSNCWIGMNSVILPGVVLGDFTIVAAGSIVKDSFEKGYCILAGNPARIIKELDPSSCKASPSHSRFRGYILEERFKEFSKLRLSEKLGDYV